PSSREIEDFDPNKGHCCTADRFRLDMEGKVKSTWNKSAATVFVDDFLAKYPGYRADAADTKRRWFVCTERFHEIYAELRESKDEIQKGKVKHRRATRKDTVRRHMPIDQLFARRLEAAKRFFNSTNPDVEQLLMALGVHGMSSDESDHENGRGAPRYYTTNKAWRSAEAQQVLRALDSLHLYGRYSGIFEKTGGNWPHFRMTSLKQSTRPVISKLPANCYAPWWLQQRSTFQREQLQVKKNIDLSISEEILRFAFLTTCL
ncbi:hypothetical protein BKA93DRAFT_739573, partial [Sparassis latifolia]